MYDALFSDGVALGIGIGGGQKSGMIGLVQKSLGITGYSRTSMFRNQVSGIPCFLVRISAQFRPDYVAASPD